MEEKVGDDENTKPLDKQQALDTIKLTRSPGQIPMGKSRLAGLPALLTSVYTEVFVFSMTKFIF